MATMTINIPDAVAVRVTNGMAGQFNYDAYAESGGTMTKAQFARYQVIEFIRTSVKNYEAEQAATTARTSAVSNAEANLTLT